MLKVLACSLWGKNWVDYTDYVEKVDERDLKKKNLGRVWMKYSN
eukprot:SAG31_NODE_2168_length_6266_cov_11.946976_7_plen_44_part_00